MFSRILMLILAGVMVVGAVVGVRAQVATPSAESLLADLGLPELTLTATDQGLELSQSDVPAGRYLITLDNQLEYLGVYVDIVRVMAEVRRPFSSCSTPHPPECFRWYSQTYLPGGVSYRTPQAIIDLPAGEYGLWGGGDLTIKPAATLQVTGDPEEAINAPEPEGVAIVVSKGEGGYGFAIRVEGELKPGPQLVRIVNAANQPLSVAAAQSPARFVVNQVAGTLVFDGARGTSPPFDTRDDVQFGRIIATRAQSANSNQWIVMDLMPGDLYLSCYVPDPVSHEDYYMGWYAATGVIVPVAGS